jgi:cyclohexanecarboxylate-CoA ligase
MTHAPSPLDPTAVRPPEEAVRRYRAAGVWRATSLVEDLQRWRTETPDRMAVVAERAGGDRVELTHRELGEQVDRAAAGLLDLGVRPRDVVAVQLPNREELPVLLLAVFSIGAVAAPMVPTLGAREVARVLRGTGAVVVVTTPGGAGALARTTLDLPRLRHRVVVGGVPRTGELGFAEALQRTDLPLLGAPGTDPDAVSVVLFTSGTTGEPKGALHSLNTLHTAADGVAGTLRDTGRPLVSATPHSLGHLAGQLTSVFLPLLSGGTAVLLEEWEPAAALRLLEDTGCTFLAAAPVFLDGLVAVSRETGRLLPALRDVVTLGTVVPRGVVEDVVEVIGLPLRVIWGMTEAGLTITRNDDPVDWGAVSVGRPVPGFEVELRGEPPFDAGRPGHLFVRGAGVTLATLGRDSGAVRVTADHDGGWYDTGDLAADDGRGGLRVLGRAVDRIGSSANQLMIPVADVEDALREHPAVADVALVGLTDPAGQERSAAVVVPVGFQPTLEELTDFLRGQGMTEWYLPEELVLVPSLPRNGNGKVEKALLRERLVATVS